MRFLLISTLIIFAFTALWAEDIESVKLIYDRETKGFVKIWDEETELIPLNFSRKVTVSNLEDPFTRWIQAEDDLGTQHFVCSFRIVPLGDQRVASYTITVRGTGEGDYKKVRFKRKNDVQGFQVFTYTDSNGVVYDFTVSEHSRSGKSFQVNIKGNVPLPKGWKFNPYQFI